MELQDKIAFITGAGSGIGRATARAMAREGARLALADRNEAALAETVRLVEDGGGTARAYPLDITDPNATDAVLARVVTDFGGLDIAHNNAGISLPPQGFVDYPLADMHRVMGVNLFGTVHCMQAEIAIMLERGGGTIVNTASAAGVVVAPGSAAYIASKHAVIGLTKAVAIEYAARGIRINSVSPGYVYTPMTAGDMPTPETERAIIAAHPIGRLARPEEVAETVLWLCSARSSYVVGANIMVDGGYTVQ